MRPVVISEDCEALAHPVAHYPVVPHITDARVAYLGERSRVDAANDRLNATRMCQTKQREKLGGGNAGGAR